MSDKIANLTRRKLHLQALAKNEDFAAIMIPYFRGRAEHHARKCRDKTLTPDKRAEHIEAAELAEDLVTYLETSLASVELELKNARK